MSLAITDVDQVPLAKLAASGAPPAVEGQPPLSGFRLMPEASFAFDARISLIRNAEKSIDVQYYIINKDDVGLLMLKELRDAAERGVRVRLLVDDLYTASEDELFATFSAFPNVEVRLFNPLTSRLTNLPARLAMSLFELSRINHRMHNKMLVADNSFSVSGGRNIANEYFMRSTAANYIDMDVVASGPVVQEMSRSFDLYWNSDHSRTIEEVSPLTMSREDAQRRFDEIARTAVPDVPLSPRDVLDQPPLGEQLLTGKLTRFWAPYRFFADDPVKIERDADQAFRGSVTQGALGLIDTAKERVVIASPYFIPGPIGMAMIRKQKEEGVEVVIVTNSLGSTDEPLAYAGYERYRVDMLKAGATIYEIAPVYTARKKRFGDFGKSISRLHAKVAMMDNHRIFIGSMNLDHRSAAINTEQGLAIDSEPLVAEYRKMIAGTNIDDIGYRLRLSEDGKHAEWLEYDDKNGLIVHPQVPGDYVLQRLKNLILLPIVGEEQL